MDALEIVDSAVKIGLGAAITAISAYVVTNRTHSNEIRKAKVTRKQDQLESVAERVERFFEFHRQYGLVARAIAIRSNHDDGWNDPEALEELTRLHSLLRNAVSEVTSAQSLLLLQNEKRTAELLTELVFASEALVLSTQKPHANMDMLQIDTLYNQVHEKKKEFYESLSGAYSSVGI